ncbi:HepT-like ribonuclease domain-containing protein [Bradyrhizobium pachyrhizi]|uniref:HepT-like ribonuclease domain-containing protein n=1 Tax=Bradyrhizobium pachyrhizi TaxID=280333 RepID=UPI00067B7501|nr:HepT-like ribonuclease domain-containing protein [Bradyrhizobium pachyrhizi]
MASTKTPAVRLQHIIAEIEAIEGALEGCPYEDFRDSWLLRRAVEHGLLIISEAAKTLPAEVKEAAAGIAWRKIETLGNFLRHEYRDVDPELIWSITQDNLPTLLGAARRLAAGLREPEPA